jgi:hypothetical protein
VRFSFPVDWADIRGHQDAYRLLTLFRSANTMIGRTPPEDLHWEISWDEQFVPLDMDDTPEVRAERRLRTVTQVALYCATAPTALGNTTRLRGDPPPVIGDLIRKAEGERGLS